MNGTQHSYLCRQLVEAEFSGPALLRPTADGKAWIVEPYPGYETASTVYVNEAVTIHLTDQQQADAGWQKLSEKPELWHYVKKN